MLHSDMTSHLPGLLNLRISGSGVAEQPRLSAFHFPPNLETLELSHMNSIRVKSGDIEKLPRSLTDLTLNAASWPRFKTYEWPLSLKSLEVWCNSASIKLESLPRTLSSLSLENVGSLRTGFLDEASLPVFPWRVFFPHLAVLTLGPSAYYLVNSELLSSILHPTTLAEEHVSKFISSGFWDVPSLQKPASSYLSYKKLTLPSSYWQQLELSSPDLVLIATHLKHAEIPKLSTEPDFLPKMQLTGLKQLSLRKPTTIETVLPARLPSLRAPSVHINTSYIAQIPRMQHCHRKWR